MKKNYNFEEHFDKPLYLWYIDKETSQLECKTFVIYEAGYYGPPNWKPSYVFRDNDTTHIIKSDNYEKITRSWGQFSLISHSNDAKYIGNLFSKYLFKTMLKYQEDYRRYEKIYVDFRGTNKNVL